MLDDNERQRRLHDFAAQTLQNEVERFWKRSLFFWGFIAAAFVGYGVLIEKADKDLPLAVSCFGLVCSVAWTLANRGSKNWQNVWEHKVRVTEVDALGRGISAEGAPRKEEGLWGAARYSVTRLTIALSDFTVLVWLTLGYKASPMARSGPWDCAALIMLGVTALYLAAIFIGGRSRRSSTP
jgi:hypothetical protein